jgi:hypothetical protein
VDEYDRRALSDDDGMHARPFDVAPDALHNECFWFAGQFAVIRHSGDHRDLMPDAHRPIGAMPDSTRFAFVQPTS